MNKRDRLRVEKTPDTTLNLDSDDSSAAEVPVAAARRRKMVSHIGKTGTQEIRKEEYAGEVPRNLSHTAYLRDQKARNASRASAFVRDNFIYLIMLFPYIVLVYFMLNRQEEPLDITGLLGEVEELKNENMRMREYISTLRLGHAETNLAKIERGAKARVEDTGKIFKYGFKGFETYRDPNIILGENVEEGKCLSFKGSSFSFIISLGKAARVSKVGIFHPVTRDVSSAIRDFEVVGRCGEESRSLGLFKYDSGLCGFQLFEFPSITADSIEITVKSNSGHRRYTCVYKVYVLGIGGPE
jgi:sperm-associated antigen 4 protein